MKKLIILATIIGWASMLIACGVSSKEKETPPTQTNVVTASSNTTTTTNTKNDGDADDIVPVNQSIANSSRSNTPARSSDLDDVRSTSKSLNSNRTNNRDTDDRGKKDTDGDDD